ncbi:AbiTii domain-containing protein [Andreprevotia chitinilytica]|uniref:AbiTii domain-containing protein n=1 Tax=Andreprevotia chitinilytica TaxID=396808 RepID=UPI0006911C38|nr:hypothetical protein [Andreprevotia chitinilytica]
MRTTHKAVPPIAGLGPRLPDKPQAPNDQSDIETTIQSIRNDLLNDQADLASLLSRTLEHTHRRNALATSRWLEYELNGYPSSQALPSYRKVAVPPTTDPHSGEHFDLHIDPDCVLVPLQFVPARTRQDIGQCHFRNAVRDYLSFLPSRYSDNDTKESWPTRFVGEINYPAFIQTLNCVGGWTRMPGSAIRTLLDAVRHRLLLVLDEAEYQLPSHVLHKGVAQRDGLDNYAALIRKRQFA